MSTLQILPHCKGFGNFHASWSLWTTHNGHTSSIGLLCKTLYTLLAHQLQAVYWAFGRLKLTGPN